MNHEFDVTVSPRDAEIALRRFLLREASLKFMTEQIKRAGGSILDNYTKAQSLP
jgi:hypothetical protein